MPGIRVIAGLATALVAFGAAGCGSNKTAAPVKPRATQPASKTAASDPNDTAGTDIEPFDRASFDDSSINIDNRYFPLQPGTRFVYTGTDGSEPLKNVTEITHNQKTILGVKIIVVLDRLYKSGSLAESTLDYYAQDEDGNVWYFGEDTKEFANGKVVSTAGTWRAGRNGARPGIIMPAHPKVGQTHQQEFAPPVAEDMATVLRLDATISVPFGTFHHCLQTADFTPLEPGAKEIKSFCPGIGFVKGRDVKGGSVRLALTKITH